MHYHTPTITELGDVGQIQHPFSDVIAVPWRVLENYDNEELETHRSWYKSDGKLTTWTCISRREKVILVPAT